MMQQCQHFKNELEQEGGALACFECRTLAWGLDYYHAAHGDTDGLGGGMFMAGDRGKRGQRLDLSPQCALPNGLTHPGAC